MRSNPRKKSRYRGLFSPPYDGPRLVCVYGRHSTTMATADTLDGIDSVFAIVLTALRKAPIG